MVLISGLDGLNIDLSCFHLLGPLAVENSVFVLKIRTNITPLTSHPFQKTWAKKNGEQSLPIILFHGLILKFLEFTI